MSEHPVLCHITQLSAQVYCLCQYQSLSVSVSKPILLVFVHPKWLTFHLFLKTLPTAVHLETFLSHSHFNSTSKRRINAEPLTFTCTTAPIITTSWFYHIFLFLSFLSPSDMHVFSFKEVFVLICCMHTQIKNAHVCLHLIPL